MSIPGGSWSGGGAGEDEHLIDASNSPGDPDPGVDTEELAEAVGEPSVPDADDPDETEQADVVIELEGDDGDDERD